MSLDDKAETSASSEINSVLKELVPELNQHLQSSQCVKRRKKQQAVFQFDELKPIRKRYLFDELKAFYDGTDYVETTILPLLCKNKNHSDNLSRRLINCLAANIHMIVAVRMIVRL